MAVVDAVVVHAVAVGFDPDAQARFERRVHGRAAASLDAGRDDALPNQRARPASRQTQRAGHAAGLRRVRGDGQAGGFADRIEELAHFARGEQVAEPDAARGRPIAQSRERIGIATESCERCGLRQDVVAGTVDRTGEGVEMEHVDVDAALMAARMANVAGMLARDVVDAGDELGVLLEPQIAAPRSPIVEPRVWRSVAWEALTATPQRPAR